MRPSRPCFKAKRAWTGQKTSGENVFSLGGRAKRTENQGDEGGKKEMKKKVEESRKRLSAFGEFYKIPQEVLETEGTMALTVAVK